VGFRFLIKMEIKVLIGDLVATTKDSVVHRYSCGYVFTWEDPPSFSKAEGCIAADVCEWLVDLQVLMEEDKTDIMYRILARGDGAVTLVQTENECYTFSFIEVYLAS